MKGTDITAILETIDEIKKLGFDEALMQHEVIAANNVVIRLRRLAELKHDILNMDRRTMSEMRSYNNPPKILHKVLKASFLLLGEDEGTTSVGDPLLCMFVSIAFSVFEHVILYLDMYRCVHEIYINIYIYILLS